jgi:hypothetical protein
MGGLPRLPDFVLPPLSRRRPAVEKMLLPGLCNRLVVNRHPAVPTLPEHRARTRPPFASAPPLLPRACTRLETTPSTKTSASHEGMTDLERRDGWRHLAGCDLDSAFHPFWGRPPRGVLTQAVAVHHRPERRSLITDAPCHTLRTAVSDSSPGVRTVPTATRQGHCLSRPERLPPMNPVRASSMLAQEDTLSGPPPSSQLCRLDAASNTRSPAFAD